MGPGQRIGLFGGTFDPVHNGHLAAAEAVKKVLCLDGIWFLPAAGPPHKIGSPITSFHHRATMLERALSDLSGFHVSPLEAELAIPSFTIDTLREFRNRLDQGVVLYFIMGMDSFVEIETWKDFAGLVDFADLVVIPRMSSSFVAAENVIKRSFPRYLYDSSAGTWRHDSLQDKGGIHLLPIPLHPVSSSQVRAELVAGRPVCDLIPDAVVSYIREHHLYTSSSF